MYIELISEVVENEMRKLTYVAKRREVSGDVVDVGGPGGWHIWFHAQKIQALRNDVVVLPLGVVFDHIIIIIINFITYLRLRHLHDI